MTKRNMNNINSSNITTIVMHRAAIAAKNMVLSKKKRKIIKMQAHGSWKKYTFGKVDIHHVNFLIVFPFPWYQNTPI